MLRSLMTVTVTAVMAAAAPAQTTTPTSGDQILRAMHDRYAGKWYTTMTFVQATTRWDSTGTPKVTTWYESAKVPSLLRIDIGSPKDGNGVLFTADSTYRFKNGKLVRTDSGGNDLTTLLFDVYVNPVEQTIASLKPSGYNLAKVHRETWEGRPTDVVGADAGDLTSPQFWVDTDRLVVVRQIGPFQPGNPKLLDARFSKYERSGGGWVAIENYFLIDGKPMQREVYSDVKADVPLDPALFDPHQWTTAKHWAK